MGVVYLIKNKVNNKCYVGITTRKIEKRLYQHFSKGSTCRLLKRSIEKYGKDNFTSDVLEECDNELLCEREVKYIREYNSFVGWENGGLNLTTGGELKKEVAQETKDKIGEKSKDAWRDGKYENMKISEEILERRKNNAKGCVYYRKNRNAFLVFVPI